MRKFMAGVLTGIAATFTVCLTVTLRKLHRNGTTLDEWARANEGYLAGSPERGNSRRETVKDPYSSPLA